jgi:hypothetical protein
MVYYQAIKGRSFIYPSRIPDMPIMLEHLNTAEEYQAAADYMRKVAEENGLGFKGI